MRRWNFLTAILAGEGVDCGFRIPMGEGQGSFNLCVQHNLLDRIGVTNSKKNRDEKHEWHAHGFHNLYPGTKKMGDVMKGASSIMQIQTIVVLSSDRSHPPPKTQAGESSYRMRLKHAISLVYVYKQCNSSLARSLDGRKQ